MTGNTMIGSMLCTRCNKLQTYASNWQCACGSTSWRGVIEATTYPGTGVLPPLLAEVPAPAPLESMLVLKTRIEQLERELVEVRNRFERLERESSTVIRNSIRLR